MFDRPMRMVGTEPFWGGLIASDGITLSGVDRPERRFPPPGEPMIGGGFAGYEVSGARFTVSAGPCSDGMSDRVYPFKAEVRIGGEVLRGCAIPERLFGRKPG